MTTKQLWVLSEVYLACERDPEGTYAAAMIATGEISAQTVYDALGHFCRLGLLTCHPEKPAKARKYKRSPRRYYRITRRGRLALADPSRIAA